MKAYLLSLGAGLLVGVVYSLLGVRSPAPPLIALLGLAILYGAGALFAFLRMRKRTIGEGMPFALGVTRSDTTAASPT